MFEQSEYKEYYELAVECAKAAGELILEGMKATSQVQVTYKDATDIVTDVDTACENLIMKKILERYPNHEFVAEESIASGNGEEILSLKPTWCIDPIDGTTNFFSRLPICCVSIGLCIKKQIVVGVVFNPILNELYTAVKGFGAFKNGEKIQVSKTEELKQCVIGTGFPYDRDDQTLDFVLGNLKKVLQNCRAVRRLGSATLDMCYVASGIYGGYYEKGVHAWDIAASTLIVTEAGGTVTTPFKKETEDFDICQREVLCGNPQITKKLRDLLSTE